MSWIGRPLRRREDAPLLTGRGRFVDDLPAPDLAHLVLVRSPHAHARVTRLDVARARKAPGVVAVITAADLDTTAPMPVNRMFRDMIVPPYPLLVRDRVYAQGAPVAAIVADSAVAGWDAAALVGVGYEALPGVSAAAAALAPGAPKIFDEAPGNRALGQTWRAGDPGAAFAGAARVVELTVQQNLLAGVPLETRGALATWDTVTGELTVWTSTQNPFRVRTEITRILALDEAHVRVIAPDVGGGFGSKIYLYAEDVVVTWASKQINRPVKWTAERSESFMTDAHGRDHLTKAELAMDKDGRFLAMRVHTTANMGAYLSTFASCIPTILYATLLAGQYTTPLIYCQVTAVFTNTTPVDAYRGAGRPEATYVVERLVETAAREMKLDPAEIRRRNFITKFPYQTPVALQYDTGNYEATLGEVLKLGDVAGYAGRKRESEALGKLRGIGYSCYIEACGIAPSAVAGSLGARAGLFEAGEVRVHPTGKVTVFTGSHSHGQGHETTFAQVVASRFGIPIEDVDIVHGDTAKILFGMGTYGSRSIAVGGTAIMKAIDKVVAKGRKIAAHLMEAAEADVEFKDGFFQVAGTDKKKAFAEIALTAYVPHNFPHDKLEPGLNENAFYDPSNFTFPAGSYVCEVEVTPETGEVRIERFTAVDDFGKIINPMIVEGQVHGGLVQGIGQALTEGCRYDKATGQLLTGSMLDYTMPRADDVPSFRIGTKETPCTHNPLGVKGCGEAGAIGSPAALMNAITDALGVKDMPMPATPQNVWATIQANKVKKAA